MTSPPVTMTAFLSAFCAFWRNCRSYKLTSVHTFLSYRALISARYSEVPDIGVMMNAISSCFQIQMGMLACGFNTKNQLNI